MATKESFNQKFSEICRLCLKQDGVMGSIFQNLDIEDEEFSLPQRISKIARVQVREDDGLPSLICHICRHQVEKSYNFRLLVEISDRTLRNCLETGQSEDSCEDRRMILKQENLDKNTELINKEGNIDLEQILLENNLTNSDIDPSAVKVILVQSEDGTQVLNICSIDEDQVTENLDTKLNVRSEYSLGQKKTDDHIASNVCEIDESTSELDDLEGIRQLLSSEKIYVQALESQIQTLYPCNECDEIFLTDDQLNSHFSTEHGEDSREIEGYDMNISCQLCLETFQSLSELKNHIAEHFNQSRNLNDIKSEADDDAIGEIIRRNENNSPDDNYQYILEVSRSNENCSETMNEHNSVDDIEGDGTEDRIIQLDTNNADKDSAKVIYEEDGGSVDLELNLDDCNDEEYKSDIFYCLKEYSSDRIEYKLGENYPCNDCGEIFTQKYQHAIHLRTHVDTKPFECAFCDEAFMTRTLRNEHERNHTDNKCFKCDICARTFLNKFELKYHQRIHTEQTQSGDKSFKCIVCGRTFLKKSELIYHESNHTDSPAFCTICNKKFKNFQSFRIHTKRHVFGSRYNCETCGKSYYTNSELARHVQMHSGKRKYPCHLCSTSFLSRPELNRHLKYHIGEKKFRCKICSKSYFESGHLKTHERMHTGEKPHVCTVCNKGFVTRPKLIRHEKIHDKEILAYYDDERNVETVKE